MRREIRLFNILAIRMMAEEFIVKAKPMRAQIDTFTQA